MSLLRTRQNVSFRLKHNTKDLARASLLRNHLDMGRHLFIIASRFEEITGGLVWTNQLAEYVKKIHKPTTIIDLSKHSSLLGNSKYLGMFYFLFYFVTKHDFFVFIDHRLHLRFNLPLLAALSLGRGRYATLCHHVLYKTKKNFLRRAVEMMSERLFLKKAEMIVVPSTRTSFEVKRLGVAQYKIKIVNPTRVFTCNELPHRAFRRKLLFVGNIEERKGVDVLIKAVMRLHDYTLDIVGDFKDEDYVRRLQEFVRGKGLSEKVFFHGRIDTTSMPDFYKNANIFVFPSRYEGYGMVLVEAMCFGLPIVATSIPTTLEIVRHGWNGYICPVDDVVCLAQCINRLLSDNELQRRMSVHNFKTSPKFRDWKDVAYETFARFKHYLHDQP